MIEELAINVMTISTGYAVTAFPSPYEWKNSLNTKYANMM